MPLIIDTNPPLTERKRKLANQGKIDERPTMIVTQESGGESLEAKNGEQAILIRFDRQILIGPTQTVVVTFRNDGNTPFLVDRTALFGTRVLPNTAIPADVRDMRPQQGEGPDSVEDEEEGDATSP